MIIIYSLRLKKTQTSKQKTLCTSVVRVSETLDRNHSVDYIYKPLHQYFKELEAGGGSRVKTKEKLHRGQ